MARKESRVRAEFKTEGLAAARKNIHIQYKNRDLTQDIILDKVQADLMAKRILEVDTIDLYIKPEENTVYYVVNGQINGKVVL